MIHPQTARLSNEDIEAVVRRHADGMYRLALHHCDRCQAQDIVQEALLRFIQSEKVFKDEEHQKAWLYRVVLNLCTDYHRHWWQKMRSDPPVQEPAASRPEQPAVLEEIRLLDFREGTAIYLHYYESMTAAEIAGILKCRTGTVYSLLSRGRAHLRQLLENEERKEATDGA